jgi:hypothetical protein
VQLNHIHKQPITTTQKIRFDYLEVSVRSTFDAAPESTPPRLGLIQARRF